MLRATTEAPLRVAVAPERSHVQCKDKLALRSYILSGRSVAMILIRLRRIFSEMSAAAQIFFSLQKSLQISKDAKRFSPRQARASENRLVQSILGALYVLRGITPMKSISS